MIFSKKPCSEPEHEASVPIILASGQILQDFISLSEKIYTQ